MDNPPENGKGNPKNEQPKNNYRSRSSGPHKERHGIEKFKDDQKGRTQASAVIEQLYEAQKEVIEHYKSKCTIYGTLAAVGWVLLALVLFWVFA